MKRIAVLSLIFALSGCATEAKFGCSGMPNGVQCKSAEDVYRQTDGDIAESPWAAHTKEKKRRHRTDKAEPKVVVKRERTVVLPNRNDPIPVRTPARVMRIWIAPWEDTEGNLHLASLVFTEIEKRRWAVGEPIGDAGLGAPGVWVPASPANGSGGSQNQPKEK